MQKPLTLLAAVLLGLAALAATLAGVTLPDTTQVDNSTLVLNGMGLRTKFMVKVYVAGLYLTQKSSDATAILNADAPKRLVMHFVRDVSKSQLTDGFNESFANNSPDAAKTMNSDVDRFLAVLEPVKDGDEIVFTYVPGTGTSVAIAGKDKLTVAGLPFSQLIYSVWLGPKPPNAGLRKGLLGQ